MDKATAIPSAPRGIQIPEALRLSALSRIVSQSGDIQLAAQRLLAAAPLHGIDPSLLFGVVHDEPTKSRGIKRRVRQACMAVLGPGRTAMMFLSEPPAGGDPEGAALARAGRAASLDAACDFLASEHRDRVALAQALPDPRDTWATDAMTDAGFRSVGTLDYLRLKLDPARSPAPELPQPVLDLGDAISAVRADVLGPDRDDRLVLALEHSYHDTLDCPELCGMRDTRDILASHRSTGRFESRLWWIILLNNTPEGCLLINPCPEQHTAELVYLGVSPALRGRGIGSRLLRLGIDSVESLRHTFGADVSEIACAVDQRNTPAIKLYRQFGFRSFASRAAMVRRLARPA